MTETSKSRILLAAGMGLLVMLPVLVLAFPEREMQVLQPVEEQRAEKPHVGRLEVQGLEAAKAARELKDPFTAMHEQAEKAPGPAEGSKGAGKETVRQPSPRAKSPGPAGEGKTAAPIKSPARLTLQGIAGGANGRLAMLSDGHQTATLAVGEKLGAWQVRAVEENRVLVAGPGGEQWLQLALP